VCAMIAIHPGFGTVSAHLCWPKSGIPGPPREEDPSQVMRIPNAAPAPLALIKIVRLLDKMSRPPGKSSLLRQKSRRDVDISRISFEGIELVSPGFHLGLDPAAVPQGALPVQRRQLRKRWWRLGFTSWQLLRS
jgi:hypothetical protein